MTRARWASMTLAATLVAATPLSGQQSPAPPAQTSRDLVLAGAKPAPPAPTGVPRGYALVIGIAQYRDLDASRQLRFSESDAQAIYRVLISPEGGAFPAENVHVLLGRDATLANVRRELETWLPSVATPADRVIVYFAGHGFVSGGRGFLAPWDVDPARLDETAYPMATLGDVLATRVTAGWKVLLADACHAGKINPESTNDAIEAQFSALPTNFLTLTATTEREQSYEDPALSTGFGFFTYFIVQAFQGAADNDPCDGRITADELVEYVRTSVRSYARERQLSQTPTARGDYEPGMLLGVGTSCIARAANPTPRLGRAIVEATLDDVDLYIDGKLIGRLSKGTPLTVPGLSAGPHEFTGVKAGYQPDRQDVTIAPGQDVTVTLRIRYVRQIKQGAVDLNAEGEKVLFSRRSSLSLLNVLPMDRRQTDDDLRRAADYFRRALAVDPDFAVAAYHLGQVEQLLGREEASLEAFRRAIALDATHVDARVEYAAAVIEAGDADEGIRQLIEALRLDASNAVALAMLSRAYWDKGAWAQAVASADRALAVDPENAQAHLWKADATRQMAAVTPDSARRQALYTEARDEYQAFLRLTNFSSSLGARLAFHFIGLGVGSRRHADRQAAYDSLRSAGFFGLCLTESKVGYLLRAREYCRRGVDAAPADPVGYFLLGNVSRDLYNVRGACDDLLAARASYTKMIALNDALDEARNARNYLAQIDRIVPEAGCR